MKETKDIFDKVFGLGENSEPILEEARPVRVKDMGKSREAIENMMDVLCDTYEDTTKELSRLVNARGDRINELVDEVASLEEQIIKLKTPKKKFTRRKASKGIESSSYKKGKDALKRLKKR